MKRFWHYALVALLATVVSVIASAALYGVMMKKQSARMGYLASGGSTPFTSEEMANNYGFQNTSLAFDASRPVGSAPDLIPAAEATVHAVVHIKVQGEQTVQQRGFDPFEFFFGGGGGFEAPQMRPVVGYGSGVIISNDGYIITNNHVIEGSNKIEVTLNDNRTFEAKKIGNDSATDIALLKVEAKDLPSIAFGNSDDLKLGEWVLAVGNPFNLTSTVTAGIVSAKARPAGTSDRDSYKIGGFIQTDAAVNSGNSGGALVNTRGELVGINTMIYSQTGNFTGYSFAVPINTAAKVVADIRKYGAVQRAVLGIVGSDINKEIHDKLALKVNSGALIVDFAEVSPAYAAGLEKEDVITAIDGRAIKKFAELQAIIAVRRPGDKVKLTVDRKGSTKSVTVTLKNTEGDEKVLTADKSNKILGASLKELSSEVRRSYGISYGLEVTEISSGKLNQAGVKKGFIILSINDVPMRDVEQARKAVATAQQGVAGRNGIILRGLYPGGRVESIAVAL